MKLSKLKTRVLSLIMSMVMLVGMVPDLSPAVYAADTDEVTVSDETVADETEEAAFEEAAEEEEAVSEETATDEEAAPEEETDYAPSVSYNIWVGGVQVTDANKDNIPGVTSGKVTYDPASLTLDFSGVNGFKDVYNNSFVYIERQPDDEPVKITGDVSVTTDHPAFVIYGPAAFSGDFTLDGKASAIRSHDKLTINEGHYYLKATSGDACYADSDLTVVNADMEISDKDNGLYSGKGNILIKGSEIITSGQFNGILAENGNISIDEGSIVTALATGSFDKTKAAEDAYAGISTGLFIDPDTGGNVYIGGHSIVNAKGQFFGILAQKDFELNDATLNASSDTGLEDEINRKLRRSVGVKGMTGVEIFGGHIKAEGSFAGLLADSGNIELKGEAKLLTPVEGRVDEIDKAVGGGATVYTGKSNYVFAQTVIIGKKNSENCYLRVGKEEVNEYNNTNIPVKSGRMTYDPDKKELNCENAVVETSEGIDEWNQAIEAYDDLTITGKLTIVPGDGDNAIEMVDKDSTLTVKDAELKIDGINGDGIKSFGDVKIVNSKIEIVCKDENSEGIYAGKNITLDKSWLKISAKKRAIWAEGKLTCDNEHEIVSPADAVWTDNSVNTGATAVKEVEIAANVTYDVWVGNTQVTFMNKDDILSDGKGGVSYDPEKKILKFNNVNASAIKGNRTVDSRTALIVSEYDIRIEGSLNAAANTNEIGIVCGSRLTIAADLDIKAAYSGIYGMGGLTIEKGTVKIDCTGDNAVPVQSKYEGGISILGGVLDITAANGQNGIYAKTDDINISGGDIKANVSGNAIEAEIGNITISDGIVTAISTKNMGVTAGKKVEITGGRLTGRGPEGAVYGKEGISYPGSVRLSTPENGKNEGGKILKEDGTVAEQADILKKGSVDWTVTFSLGHGLGQKKEIIKDGESINRPEDPVLEGWIFAGWYKDSEYTTEFDFNSEIVRNTIIYAKWDSNAGYDLWLGDKKVTSENCADIYGDGTASYDPATKTLTLDNPEITGISEKNAAITANTDLIIKGKLIYNNNSAFIGIYAESGTELVIDADLKIKVLNIPVYANGDLKITGGKLDLEAVQTDEKKTSKGIQVYGNLLISGGEINAKGNDAGIWYQNNKSLMKVSGGTITAEGNRYSGLVLRYNEGIDLAGHMYVSEPENYSVKSFTTPGTYYGIADADGNAAKIVKIGSSLKMYTVSFNLMGHGDAIAAQNIVSGNKAEKPADPIAEGWKFGGWYTEKELVNEYSFDTAVSGDIELFAKWTEVSVDPSKERSALDTVAVLNADETVYLVKGQKFMVPAGWFVDKKDKNSKKIVSISKKGQFKAKKNGEAVVYFGTDKAVSANIVVCTPSIEKTSKTIKLNAGESRKISLSGFEADKYPVLYYSASPDVAQVEDGEVYALAKGTAKISVFINGKELKCTVKVSEPETLKSRTMHIAVGSTKSISVKGVKGWNSENNDVAETLSKGKKVKAKAAGETVLTASVNDVEYNIDVYAEDLTIGGEKIELDGKPGKNKYKMSLKKGESDELVFSDSVMQDMIFKSSKPDVAFVDEEGHVEARSKGSAKFTAKIDGKTITIKVVVTE